MPKDFSSIAEPVMIYNEHNEYTIIEAAQLQDALSAGWSDAPLGDIHTAPSEFIGAIDLAPADSAVAPKKSKSK